MTSETKTNGEFLTESREILPAERWSLFEKMVLMELTRTLFTDVTFNIESLCSILSNTEKYNFPCQRLFSSRTRTDISKQVFNIIAHDNAFQVLLAEQLRMNSL